MSHSRHLLERAGGYWNFSSVISLCRRLLNTCDFLHLLPYERPTTPMWHQTTSTTRRALVRKTLSHVPSSTSARGQDITGTSLPFLSALVFSTLGTSPSSVDCLTDGQPHLAAMTHSAHRSAPALVRKISPLVPFSTSAGGRDATGTSSVISLLCRLLDTWDSFFFALT